MEIDGVETGTCVARTRARPSRLVDYFVATPTRYGFFVGLAFGGGGGTFVFVFTGGFALVFVLTGAGLLVFIGAAVFTGLFSLVAVLQPTAKAPRAKVANSAAIFDLVMKPPLWSAVTEHSKKPLLDDFVKL